MAQTTIRVVMSTRDKLRALSARLGAASMDDAVRTLMWEHECREAVDRLEADPEAFADYQAETDMLANAATEVIE